jgi:hypothetical protein
MLRLCSGFFRANAPLLASQQAHDIVGVAPIEQHGEKEKQQSDLWLAEKDEDQGDCGARRERGVG